MPTISDTRLTVPFLPIVAALLLAACTVPEHIEVRAGIDPENQDENVRFRTIPSGSSPF